MGFLPEVETEPGFGPFAGFHAQLGFVPNLFRAQSLLPRLIEAEASIAEAVLLSDGALSRRQKECIVLAVAADRRDRYCVTAHSHLLRSLGMAAVEVESLVDGRGPGEAREDGLLAFCRKLAGAPTAIRAWDVNALRAERWTDEAILEAIQVTSLARFLCTLSAGLGVEPDFQPAARLSAERRAGGGTGTPPPDGGGPYLRAVPRDAQEFPPFAFFQASFGFIPNIFRAQTLTPRALEAEAEAVRKILLAGDVLGRVRKEYILLVVSAANLNSYCVAVHCEMLRGLGVEPATAETIAVDHREADLSEADRALLDFALKLACRPSEFGGRDVEALLDLGFTASHVLEAVVMTALTNFLNTLQMGLGTVPEFPVPARMNPSAELHRPMSGSHPPEPSVDPDADLVASARRGNLESFEALVRRHTGPLNRMLLGVTASPEDAEDALQSAFLKAYRGLDRFRGDSRFSTWLTRIAINEAIQRLRRRREMLPLLDEEGDEMPAPRHLQGWQGDPEESLARSEQRRIVEAALLTMPVMYRVPVILRDLQQLSTNEAAAALDLPVPTLKTRLLRGRLLLRDAIAPHFRSGQGAQDAP